MKQSVWGGKVAVCAILLVWIFHSIFQIEAQQMVTQRGDFWDSYSSADRWSLTWSLGPASFWQTLTTIRPGAFLVSLLMMGATILLGTFRWRLMLRVHALPLSLWRTLEISMVAHFFNSFLLGSTGGDLFKAVYVARETHRRKAEAITTVLADRLIGLSSMLFFACALMLPNRPLLAGNPRMLSVALLVGAMMAACIGAALLTFCGGSGSRLSPWINRLPGGHLLERALEAFRRIGANPGVVIRSIAISMGINLVCVLQISALAHGLSIDVDMTALLFIVPAIICISALPITPNGLGVRENLYVFMLSSPALGIDPTLALTISLLAYAGSLIWSLFGGVVYLTLKRSHPLSELATMQNNEEISDTDNVSPDSGQ